MFAEYLLFASISKCVNFNISGSNEVKFSCFEYLKKIVDSFDGGKNLLKNHQHSFTYIQDELICVNLETPVCAVSESM